jgi:hypothetical protein
MDMNRETDAARPDRTAARVARRIALAEQELQSGDPASTVSALELIGSAVADWTLNSSKSCGLLTSAHQTPATSQQLKALRDYGLLDTNRLLVLQTAYQARNLAHHEQIGLDAAESLVLLSAVRWAVHDCSGSADTGKCPVPSSELISISELTKRLGTSQTGSKTPRHLSVVLNLDRNCAFDPDWGPSNYSRQDRAEIVQATSERGMLRGIIRNQHWPLIGCDICRALVPIDNCWTPQEECVAYADEPIETFCGFGCSEMHR